MRTVVRQHGILLGLGMGVGTLSMALGSLASWTLHVSGLWISMTAFGLFVLLLFKIRPDFFR